MNSEQPSPNPASPAHHDVELGNWPEPASMAGVIFSGIVWSAWIIFLIWMMVERLNTPQ